MTGWGCPHDDGGNCVKRGAPCEPGEKGCVLEERMKKPGEVESGKGER